MGLSLLGSLYWALSIELFLFGSLLNSVELSIGALFGVLSIGLSVALPIGLSLLGYLFGAL
jgi:hypothetical protein